MNHENWPVPQTHKQAVEFAIRRAIARAFGVPLANDGKRPFDPLYSSSWRQLVDEIEMTLGIELPRGQWPILANTDEVIRFIHEAIKGEYAEAK